MKEAMTRTDDERIMENEIPEEQGADVSAEAFETSEQRKYVEKLTPSGVMIPGTDRLRKVLDELGNPQNGLPVIHITGSNGKGSIARYLEAIFRAEGRHTGLFTSPYLSDYRDMVRSDGAVCTWENLNRATDRVLDICRERFGTEHYLTSFETVFAASLLIFVKEKTEVLICEVGLGGRDDATNVFPSKMIDIIGRIVPEHTAILGSTTEEIAENKAGIIRPGDDVLLYPSDETVVGKVLEVAKRRNATVRVFDVNHIGNRRMTESGQCFSFAGETYDLKTDAPYQVENAAMAIVARKMAEIRTGWKIREEALKEGLLSAVHPGRMEWREFISGSGARIPLLLDGAHNPDGIRYPLAVIRKKIPGEISVLLGILEDKAVDSMLNILSEADAVFYTVPVPAAGRRSDPEYLAGYLRRTGKRAEAFEDIPAAWEAVRTAGRPVLVTGSLYLVRTVLRCPEIMYDDTHTSCGKGEQR